MGEEQTSPSRTEQYAGDRAIQIGVVTGGEVNIEGHPLGKPKASAFRAIRPPRTFVGRETEMQVVTDALRCGGAYQLCGMGGVGKSALVAKVIEDLPTDLFPDGILWVSLRSSPNVEAVCGWIADAYGIELGADALATLRGVLHDKRALIVLDNAENDPSIVPPICEARGNATVIVITRDRAAGATCTDTLNEISPLRRGAAVELLMEQLGSETDERKIEQICGLVGDLPLALVLAVAYIRVYDIPLPDYIAALDKTPLDSLHLAERRRESVFVTLELSWNRLSKDAQRALQVVSIAPGETIGTAAVSAGMCSETVAAEKALRSLYRHSMVSSEQNRWSAHSLVRAYALDTMEEREIEGLRIALRSYYLEYIMEYRGRLGRDDYQALQPGYENILGAMEWSYRAGDWAEVIAYANALDGHLAHLGHTLTRQKRANWWLAAARRRAEMDEQGKALWALGDSHYILSDYARAQQRFEDALSVFEQTGSETGQAKTIYGMGKTSYVLGDYEKARDYCKKAVTLFKEVGDRFGEADATCRLGYVYERLADYQRALDYYESARELSEDSGNSIGKADAIRGLGKVYLFLGEYDKSEEYLQEALSIFRSIGARHKEAHAMSNLGKVYYRRGQVQQSQKLFDKAQAAYREVGDRLGEASAGLLLGKTKARLNKHEQAREMFEVSLKAYRELGSPNGESLALLNLGNLARDVDEYERAESKYRLALSISRTIGTRKREALILDSIGKLAMAQEDYETAVQYFDDAIAIYEATRSMKNLSRCHSRRKQATEELGQLS